MSFKIQLQERVQKRGGELPKYVTRKYGGDDHAPLWRTAVIVYDQTYTGAIRSRKKDAENSAAQVALLASTSPDVKKPLILIDLENQGDSIEFLKEYEFGSAEVWGIASQGHPTLTKANGLITVKEVPTTVSDGADIGLCIEAALAMSKHSPIIIVSNDHFAIGLQECLVGLYDHDTYVVGSLKELAEFC